MTVLCEVEDCFNKAKDNCEVCDMPFCREHLFDGLCEECDYDLYGYLEDDEDDLGDY